MIIKISINGIKNYSKNNCSHNDYGPSFVCIKGQWGQRRSYRICGFLHNKKGAAIVYEDGTKHYFICGELKSYKCWLEEIKHTTE